MRPLSLKRQGTFSYRGESTFDKDQIVGKRSIMARLEQRRKVCENLPILRKTSGKFFERMGGIRDDRSHASTKSIPSGTVAAAYAAAQR